MVWAAVCRQGKRQPPWMFQVQRLEQVQQVHMQGKPQAAPLLPLLSAACLGAWRGARASSPHSRSLQHKQRPQAKKARPLLEQQLGERQMREERHRDSKHKAWPATTPAVPQGQATPPPQASPGVQAAQALQAGCRRRSRTGGWLPWSGCSAGASTSVRQL